MLIVPGSMTTFSEDILYGKGCVGPTSQESRINDYSCTINCYLSHEDNG